MCFKEESVVNHNIFEREREQEKNREANNLTI